MSTAGAPGVPNTLSGGVFFKQVVRRQTVAVVLSATGEPASSGLPQATSTFTSRDVYLQRLLQALTPNGDAEPA